MTISPPAPWPQDEYAALLRTGLLQNIADVDVAALLPSFVRVPLRRDEEVFHQDDVDDGAVFVVVEGRVALSRDGGPAGSLLQALLSPGDLFGELSAFDPGPRTTTGKALTPSVVARLEREDLLVWASGRPQVARQMFQVLARRLRRTSDSAVDLVFVDVAGRVARRLVMLQEQFGSGRDGIVTHGLTQDQLAAAVGAARETVNKALRDFESRGWIVLSARGFRVLDLPSLTRRGTPR
jgi:CRP/FNR family cyclic AMP-dependent transcriptional regulator